MCRKGNKSSATCLLVEAGPKLRREAPMPDDKSKVGEPDRSRVAAEHGGRRMRYPSAHGSGGYAFTHSEKTQLIERFGNDREKLYAAAETLKLG